VCRFAFKAFLSLSLPISLVAQETVFSNLQEKEERDHEDSSSMFLPEKMKESKRLYLEAQMLYGTAHLSDLGFATKSKAKTYVRKGKVKDPKFNWNWGFKVGFGYNIPHDGWDIQGGYTQFRSDTHTSTYAPEGGTLFPQWLSSSSQGVDYAKAHWNFHLQLSDLELGKMMKISSAMTLRPFIGVRGAWISQKYNITYTGGPSLVSGQSQMVNMRNHFWGVGGRLGANSLYAFGKGVGHYADGALSLLSGFFHVTEQQKLSMDPSSGIGINAHPQDLVTILDLSLGLQYDTFFKKRRYHLGFKLGYEFDYLFNQNQFLKTISGQGAALVQSQGDLSLMGLSFAARFDF
jgi:hypothetical protein